MMNQGPMFRPIQPYSPVRFSPVSAFGGPPTFGLPTRSNFPPKHSKFPGKHFRKNLSWRRSANHVPGINMTKPWVTEEIRNEKAKTQELFESWKNIKTAENWTKYEVQEQALQALYNKARVEYAAEHPNEVALWKNSVVVKHFFCETCDKSFRSNDDLLLHEAEHETCGREGCEFTAHPKIIAKHIKMQHESGLYKRIGKLYSEEDIHKWIEERKKRYPTRKVVEEKRILEQEKLNRGERIKEDDSKFNKSFNNKGKREKKNFEKRTNKSARNRRNKKKKPISVVVHSVEDEISTVRKGVPAFLGINTSNETLKPEKEDFDISDEEWETDSKAPVIPKPLLNSSLGLLAMSYDSDVEIKEKGSHKMENMLTDEESGPEEVSSKNPLLEQKLNEEKVLRKRKSSERRSRTERKRKNAFIENNFEKRSLTLLEKLLKNEIRHERNIILQCVHYVVKNNFFKT